MSECADLLRPCGLVSTTSTNRGKHSGVFSFFPVPGLKIIDGEEKSSDHHGKDGRRHIFFVTGAGFLFYEEYMVCRCTCKLQFT